MKASFLVSAIALALSCAAYSQPPASNPAPNAQAQGARGGQAPAGSAGAGAPGLQAPGRGPAGGGGTSAMGSAEIAPLIFEEHWTNNLPNAEPATHDHLSNQNLLLHLYGDSDHIRATNHPTEAYTYTGETITKY